MMSGSRNPQSVGDLNGYSNESRPREPRHRSDNSDLFGLGRDSSMRRGRQKRLRQRVDAKRGRSKNGRFSARVTSDDSVFKTNKRGASFKTASTLFEPLDRRSNSARILILVHVKRASPIDVLRFRPCAVLTSRGAICGVCFEQPSSWRGGHNDYAINDRLSTGTLFVGQSRQACRKEAKASGAMAVEANGTSKVETPNAMSGSEIVTAGALM